MARIIAGAQDLDAARRIAEGKPGAPDPGRWTLLTSEGMAATVRSVGRKVGIWADADPEALEPGEARRLALALLEHADMAERAGE